MPIEPLQLQNTDNLKRFSSFKDSNLSNDIVNPIGTDGNIQKLRDIRQEAIKVMQDVPNQVEGTDFNASEQLSPDQIPPELGTLDKMIGAEGQITQGYGNPNSIYKSGTHGGVDFAVPTGTSVALPAGQWKVLKAFSGATAQGPNNAQEGINGGYGNSILAQNTQTGEMIRVSHLSKVGVGAGQIIPGGKVIALSGATGKTRGRTGQHVDVEYYNQKGQRADILKSPYAQYIL